MGAKLAQAVVACLLAASCVAPSLCWADDSLGSVDEPAVPIAPASASGSQAIERSPQDDDGVVVSAAGDAALIEGCRFAVADFTRSQSGSNRAVDGAYQGYNYYVGTEPDNLAVVSTGSMAVVYVPAATASAFRIDLASAADQQLLQRYLVALDSAAAKGSARLEAVADWRFTSDQRYRAGGVEFRFDMALQEGRYYTCVIGEDGGDVTAPSHSAHVQLAHADFGRIVDPHAVVIQGEATGLEWLAAFLADMDYSPLWVTLRTTGLAIVLIFVLGLAAAYFTLRLPSRAQDAFDSIFTIPIANIRQSFKITTSEILHDESGSEMVERMGSFYPIIRLHQFYNIETDIVNLEDGILMWVEASDRSFCLFVDELIGEQQIVVKPLPTFLNYFELKNYGITGCSILGDGNITIILDVLSFHAAALENV